MPNRSFVQSCVRSVILFAVAASSTAYSQVVIQPPGSGGSSTPTIGPPVSSASPLYLMAHYRNDDEKLHLSAGNTANLASLSAISPAPSDSRFIHDPSVFQLNGTFYFVATTQAAATSFQFFTSTDLITFSSSTLISPGVAGETSAWAPEWQLDPTTGLRRVCLSADSAFPPSSQYCASFTPPSTFGAFTRQTINNLPANFGLIDNFSYYDSGNSTWYWFYSEQNTSNVSRINYGTSSTSTGTITLQAFGDPFGFGDSAEAPAVIALPNGTVNVCAVTYDLSSLSPDGAKFQGYKCVTTTNHFLTVGTPAPLPGPSIQHGTIIAITSQTVADTVYTAIIAQNGQADIAGNLGLNCAGYFTLTACGFQNGPIFNAYAPGIGAGVTGAAPETFAAMFYGSDSSNLSNLAPQPTASNADWIVYGSAPNGGLMQFVNPGSGPAFIAFTDSGSMDDCVFLGGQIIAGSNPQTVWLMGTNYASLGAENDNYFVYGKPGTEQSPNTEFASGGIAWFIDSLTGQVHDPFGLLIPPVAAASLPTCSSTYEGLRRGVNNSNAVSFTVGIGSVVAGGGTTHVPVYCDGTSWRIG